MLTIAKAPAKIILCGEHGVVMGSPAIVQAIDCYTWARVSDIHQKELHISCSQYGWHRSWQLEELQKEAKSIQKSWQGSFQEKKAFCLPHPLDWILRLSLDLGIDQRPQGLSIEIRSDIQPNLGLGSSAAAISSVLAALSKHLQMKMSQDEMWQVAKDCESLCHGKSSGMDLACSLFGGRIYFQGGQIRHMSKAQLDSLYLLMTNPRPEHSTASCVKRSCHAMSQDPGLIDEISKITTDFYKAIVNLDQVALKAHMNEASNWLFRVGVVPLPVQHLIQAIQSFGAGAKISGAGAIDGEGAGLILVLAEPEAALKVQTSLGLDLQAIRIVDDGAWQSVLG